MSAKSTTAFPNSTADAFHVEGDFSIVPSTYEHAQHLQHYLRQEDIRECLIHGSTPWRALHLPLKVSGASTWTLLHKGTAICMGGVIPHEENDVSYGTIWMLGSYELNRNRSVLLKLALPMLEHILEWHDFVENVVPVDHHRTLRWLERLGFMFAEETTVVNGYECVRFVRCNPAIEMTFDM